LDENKDEQILKEACLGLCQLFGEGIQNDRIQAILEADVVPRLVALLKPNRSRTVPVSVQSAALQVIGNVACGDDRQTQVIIDCDALPCLKVRFRLWKSLRRGKMNCLLLFCFRH
jgi:importin subunit alpha-6/7